MKHAMCEEIHQGFNIFNIVNPFGNQLTPAPINFSSARWSVRSRSSESQMSVGAGWPCLREAVKKERRKKLFGILPNRGGTPKIE